MLFNSFIFILVFLPLTLLAYFGLRKTEKFDYRKYVLIVASLIFVGYIKIYYLIILLISVLVNYYINKVISISQDKRKISMIIGVIFNILFLGVFKYTDFILENIASISNMQIPALNILLPLGVSFYTFQQISLVVDNYRGEISSLSFIDYMLYVTYFPKFIQGPIVRYNEFIVQFSDETKCRFNYENFAKGLYIFSLGLAKKVLVADNFGKIVDYGHLHISSLNSFEAILTILAYTIQLYFDFSGYCDMAQGVSHMFNIELPWNFDSPYKTRNVSEFWKKWHMTLNQFLTKYVYIPLGGSRKGEFRTCLNILIVFAISGIWHGVGYTFIFWGLLQGVASVLYRLMKKPYEKIPEFLQWVLNFGFINISWTFFRAESITSAMNLFKQVFSGGFGINAELMETLLQPTIISLFSQFIPFNIVIVLFVVLIMAVIMVVKNTNKMISEFEPGWKNGIITYILLVWGIVSISGVSTFLYFNF